MTRLQGMAWMLGVGLALQVGTASAAQPVPLVASSVDAPAVELVKKRSRDGDGERGWFDYLKMAITFEDEEVVDAVKDGRVVEHILGGLLSEVGGHIWAPKFAYKDAPDDVPGALVLGVIGTVLGIIPIGLFAFAIVPFIGWYLFWFWWFLALCFLALAGFMNLWVIPRALQFAYSDAYKANGGGGSKRRKHRSRDDDDE